MTTVTKDDILKALESLDRLDRIYLHSDVVMGGTGIVRAVLENLLNDRTKDSPEPITTKSQEFILRYLNGKGWTSPTQIGYAYGDTLHPSGFHNYHSAWASPKCRKLVKMGWLERNENGHYRRIRRD